MPSTYSTSLRIELVGNGEQNGIWGQTLNNDLGTLIEQAITGVGNIDLTGYSSYSLTSYDGLPDEARNNVLVFTGLPVANAVVTAPTVEKVYIVSNQLDSGYSVTVKTSGGNGVSILNGTSQLIYCDGTDFYTGVSVNSIFGNLTVSGNSTVANAVSVGGKITVNNSVTSSSANITMTANSSIISMLPNLGGFVVPQGTSAQRPASPKNGMARWNTDLGAYEIWNGADWENIVTGSYNVSYLIVAGGGGGGGGGGGAAGGGAGGLLSNTTAVIAGTSYPVVVGSGGTAGTEFVNAGNGANSSVFSLISIGGGKGGNYYLVQSGGNGGSGGGANNGSPGSGTSGQGYAGGIGNNSYNNGGGGGGAGSVGADATTGAGGSGGSSVANTITGSSVNYAAGGGGATNNTGPSNAGTAYTGNGGGAGSSGGAGGVGGSGVVIIRYAYPTQRATGGNVTSYTSGATKYWVHTFTTSGTFIA